MRTTHLLSVLSVLSIPLTGCSPYSPSLGSAPFTCSTSDPTCPDGYTCDTTGTAPVCRSGNAPDGGTSGFACANDMVLEGPSKNDTIATASSTSVATSRNSISYTGLAICPNGDKDTYRVDITTTPMSLKATVVYDPISQGGAALSVALLNSSGLAIAQGSPNGENTVMVSVPSPTANSAPYYVSVYGPPTGQNNYKLTIEVTP